MPQNVEKPFNQVQAALKRGATAVPLLRELPADTLTPVAGFLRLRRGEEPAFLLESVEGGEQTARYSFLGTRPLETLTVRNGVLKYESGAERGILPGPPFSALSRRIGRYRALPESGLPPFCGGAVGHIGYEMIRHLEPKTGLSPAPGEDEARLQIYANVAAFDQVKHRLLLIANILPDVYGAGRKAYGKAIDALDDMEARFLKPEPRRPARCGGRALFFAPRARMGAKTFQDGVRALKSHIRAGDIFQAVLSDRFDMPLRTDSFSVYRSLRMINPSPYMFYIGGKNETVLGASPEMLVRVSNGEVETRPIAGTRPRGKTEQEDRKLETQLLASVKERAEHLMLVDLGRNDVGRVCVPGSVAVPTFMQVERYSHVMHIVSSVKGRLKRGAGPWDAFAACFPAGTVSGAPKIKAMELLGKLEREPRGLYAGAIVYNDFHGNLDSAIAIRSVSVRGKGARAVARVQAGAGIVADSRPAAELDEIRAKSNAMIQAVREAE